MVGKMQLFRTDSRMIKQTLFAVCMDGDWRGQIKTIKICIKHITCDYNCIPHT